MNQQPFDPAQRVTDAARQPEDTGEQSLRPLMKQEVRAIDWSSDRHKVR